MRDNAKTPETQEDLRPPADRNIDELEMLIGMTARDVLYHVISMRADEMKLARVTWKDKADISLRAITALEGSKQTVTWQDEMRKKKTKVSAKQLASLKQEKTERLQKLLLRNKAVQVRQAEAALREIEKRKEQGTPVDDASN